MTPEEMRIAIAKKCGWIKRLDHKNQEYWECFGQAIRYYPPDYPNDLNVMHEAIMAQPQNVRDSINHTLMESLRPNDRHILDRTINSTAAQRAEAFCRVFWPERFKPAIISATKDE